LRLMSVALNVKVPVDQERGAPTLMAPDADTVGAACPVMDALRLMLEPASVSVPVDHERGALTLMSPDTETAGGGVVVQACEASKLKPPPLPLPTVALTVATLRPFVAKTLTPPGVFNTSAGPVREKARLIMDREGSRGFWKLLPLISVSVPADHERGRRR
jgi:CBS domain-containing protein